MGMGMGITMSHTQCSMHSRLVLDRKWSRTILGLGRASRLLSEIKLNDTLVEH